MLRTFLLACALLSAPLLGGEASETCGMESATAALLADDALGKCVLIGESPSMRTLRQDIALVAPHKDVSALIIGRTGTGKEIIAFRIHHLSPRSAHPFLPINCATLTETLLESQLFGHKKGAFTGATADNPGLLVSAGDGTVFLDEIGEMPIGLQAKLLRALQQKEVLPVGSNSYVPFRARVLAATNRDLLAAIPAGTFRADLYYRLAVWEVDAPELVTHLEDIEPISTFVLGRICKDLGMETKRLAPETVRELMNYSWPGNVRQLENVLTRASIYAGSSPTILPTHLPARLMPPTHLRIVPDPASPVDEFNLDEGEKRLIKAALDACDWNRVRAATRLGINRRTLAAKITKYDLTPPSHLLATGTGDD